MFVTCKRCGYVWETEKTRPKLCSSCRYKPSQYDGDCIPHLGEFAPDQITPLDEEGNIISGFRTCGKADCINANHIEGDLKWR